MKPCYIFDLDGTLSDCAHRIHFIQKDPKDWASFYAGCVLDAPIKAVCELLYNLADSVDIFIFTGRSDEVREQTEVWLSAWTNLEFGPNDLYMRVAGDHRHDDVIKLEMLASLRSRGYDPIMAFEDRSRVVAMWRAAGVPCAQVAPGDF